MNTTRTSLREPQEASGNPGEIKSLEVLLEIVRSRYTGTFELIEDPNNPRKYYDGPY